MLFYNIRIALRALTRQKSYSLITLTGLGIGMASCLLIMIFVLDELSFDQYHTNKDRIYRFATEVRGSSFGGIAKLNGPWGLAAKDQIPEIEVMARFVFSGQLLVGYDNYRAYEPDGFYADPAALQMFSFRLISGNPETALTDPNTIVVTRSFAKKYFGDQDAIGKILRIDNRIDYKVTGLLEDVPSNSHFTFTYLLSMPSLQHPQKDSWTAWNQFYTYLLLREGAHPEAVATKIKRILAQNLDAETAANYAPLLQPLTDIHLRSHLHREMTANGDTTSLYVFSSIALLILAISCANFISMSTAQASVRAKEVGVRKVNGAVRKQVAFQFLTEAFIICFLSLLLAETMAFLGLPLLNELTAKKMATSALTQPATLGGAVTIAVLTALLAGIYPSLYQSALKPVQVLKGRFTSPGNVGVRKGLVVFQFALSSLLVIGSVVILQQLQFISHKPLGFDPEQIVTFPIQSDVLRSKYELVKKELLSHEGVVSVSLSGNLPGGSDWGIPSLAEGFTSENMPPLRVMAADADFLKTFGMELAGGRNFSEDLASDSTTYLINEAAARQLGWTDPLSKSISMPAVGRSQGSVIGVVKDFHFRSLHENIGGILFFVPPRSWYSLYSIKLNASQTKETLEFIEQKIASFDPDHPFTFSFFDESYSRLYEREARLAQIVGYFTAVGIFLACLGLYSLASFTAQQRTKEIGIRKVIGASAGQIVIMLSRQFLMLVTIGFAIAVPAAWWVLERWLQSFAYHVNFSVTAVVVCGLLSTLIALFTVGYRAIRAAIANPVNALRNE